MGAAEPVAAPSAFPPETSYIKTGHHRALLRTDPLASNWRTCAFFCAMTSVATLSPEAELVLCCARTQLKGQTTERIRTLLERDLAGRV